MKKISILGSTGSIGKQTLEVIDNLGNFKVTALCANENVSEIYKQIVKYKPNIVALFNEEKAEELTYNCKGLDVKVLSGMDGVASVAREEEAGIVLSALVGSKGLLPTIEAIKAGKDIALANKETLVCGGAYVMELAKKQGVNIYPVDSEHSAIFQCLSSNPENEIKTIYLTASGGPFRGYSKEMLKNVTVKEALNHPNWSMGKKITIDSATMMNKGLEVIEAKWLFDVKPENIKVLVHPQSIIHSMVEFKDNAVLAQLGEPDMKIPIQYALTYPERRDNSFNRINFLEKNSLTFEAPDFESFPCLSHAYRALEIGGHMPAVLNGANESAVSMFLDGKIGFTQIAELIDKAMNAYNEVDTVCTVESIINADNWAREYVLNKEVVF